MSKARRELVTTSRCSRSRCRSLADGIERILDVGKSRNHRLAIDLQQFVLRALLQIEIAEKLAAMEDRLGQSGRGRVDHRLRPQQQLEEMRFHNRLRQLA